MAALKKAATKKVAKKAVKKAAKKATASKAFKSISGIEPAQPVLTTKPVVIGGKRVVKKPAREDAPF